MPNEFEELQEPLGDEQPSIDESLGIVAMLRCPPIPDPSDKAAVDNLISFLSAVWEQEEDRPQDRLGAKGYRHLITDLPYLEGSPTDCVGTEWGDDNTKPGDTCGYAKD